MQSMTKSSLFISSENAGIYINTDISASSFPIDKIDKEETSFKVIKSLVERLFFLPYYIIIINRGLSHFINKALISFKQSNFFNLLYLLNSRKTATTGNTGAATVNIVDATVNKVVATVNKVVATVNKVVATVNKVAATVNKVAATVNKVAATVNIVDATVNIVAATVNKVAATVNMVATTVNMVVGTGLLKNPLFHIRSPT